MSKKSLQTKQLIDAINESIDADESAGEYDVIVVITVLMSALGFSVFLNILAYT